MTRIVHNDLASIINEGTRQAQQARADFYRECSKIEDQVGQHVIGRMVKYKTNNGRMSTGKIVRVSIGTLGNVMFDVITIRQDGGACRRDRKLFAGEIKQWL